MSVGAVETVERPSNTPQVSDGKETKDWYAWSNIRFGAEIGEGGYVAKNLDVKYGDKVNQKDLGVDDNEWNKLVEERVVRKSVPPQTKQYESPKRALIARAKAAMEQALSGGE